MAGTVKEAKLQNPTARKRLKPGRQLHYQTIVPGRAHLSYQRWEDELVGRWQGRYRRAGRHRHEFLGMADDCAEADGVSILDYQQARSKAVELSMDETRPAGRLTVLKAMSAYLDHLTTCGKSIETTESAATNWILPKLANHEVASLTAAQIRQWHAWVAEGSKDSEGPLNEEQIRRRRVSANRHLSVLKAALNYCYDEGLTPSNSAWSRRVKKYRGVANTRARSLTVDECRRFLDACDAVFKPLAMAGLQTGMRYGELCRLQVGDFDKTSGTLIVGKSKTSRSRRVVVTEEGTRFFSDATAGRQPSATMFVKADGKPWGTATRAGT